MYVTPIVRIIKLEINHVKVRLRIAIKRQVLCAF